MAKRLLDQLKDGVDLAAVLASDMAGFETERQFTTTVYNGKKGPERKELWKVEKCLIKINYAGNTLAEVMGRDARSTTISVQNAIRTKWTEDATRKAFASGNGVVVDPNNIAALEDPEKAKELALGGVKHMLASADSMEAKKAILDEMLAAAGLSAADLVG